MNIRTFFSITIVVLVLAGLAGCGGPERAPEGSAGKPETVAPPASDPAPPPH